MLQYCKLTKSSIAETKESSERTESVPGLIDDGSFEFHIVLAENKNNC